MEGEGRFVLLWIYIRDVYVFCTPMNSSTNSFKEEQEIKSFVKSKFCFALLRLLPIST